MYGYKYINHTAAERVVGVHFFRCDLFFLSPTHANTHTPLHQFTQSHNNGFSWTSYKLLL